MTAKDTSNPRAHRRDAFEFAEELAAFEESLLQLLREQVRIARESVLPIENVQRYNHGSRWTSLATNRSERESSFKAHSTIVEIPMLSMVEHDLAAIPKYLSEMIGGVHSQFMQTMYATVSEACGQCG
jgi:hypothetical protein